MKKRKNIAIPMILAATIAAVSYPAAHRPLWHLTLIR